MFVLKQRTKLTVIKISDANLAMRIVMFILLEIVRWHPPSVRSRSVTSQVLLSVMQATDPIVAQTRIETALPKDLLVQYCAPMNLGLIATIGAIK